MIQYPGFPMKNLLPGANGLLINESCCWDTSTVQSSGSGSSSRILPGILRSPAALALLKHPGESTQAQTVEKSQSETSAAIAKPKLKPRTYPPWTRHENGELTPVPKPRRASAEVKGQRQDDHFSAVILKEIPIPKPRLSLAREKSERFDTDKENLNISKSQEFKQWSRNYENELKYLGERRRSHSPRFSSPLSHKLNPSNTDSENSDMNSSRETESKTPSKPLHKRVAKYCGNKLFTFNVKPVAEHKFYESNF